MSGIKWQHGLALAVCFLFISSMTAMCKTPVLKNTRWTAVQKLFVADAGTMTITYTLEFISDKDVRIREESHMPSYPASYMNADGTVDTIPGHSSETVEAGTYHFRRGKLTVTMEDSLPKEFALQRDGTFTVEWYGDPLVFSRITEE
ncbi:MAG: hypothetical protein GXY24_08735 [Bacteroidales bacterium]|jgi:hypothetical protein|nr:hypothetical protein [Bacteroidales bacterium]